MRRFVLALGLMSCLAGWEMCGCQPAVAQEKTKLPVPSADAQKKSVEVVRDLFRKEMEAAKTPQLKTALAQRMIEEARNTTDDPAGRFVLLRGARELAAQAGDCTTAISAIDELDEGYAIDYPQMAADVLDKLLAAAKGSDDYKTVAEAAIAALGRLGAEQSATVERLSKLAGSAAKKSRDAGLVKRAADETQRLAGLAESFQGVAKAQATLEKEPTDPEANLVVGRYQCFAKGDWETGVPMLALGSDEALKKAAQEELSSPDKAAERAKIGDLWWDVAEKQSDPNQQKTIKRHAAAWYENTTGELSGLVRARTEKRLAELAKLGGPKEPEAGVATGAAVPDPSKTSRPAPSTAGKLDGLKYLHKSPPVPGLVARIIHAGSSYGNRPTPALAVVTSATDINIWVMPRYQQAAQSNEYFSSYPNSYYSVQAMGQLVMKKTGPVKVELTNCRCTLDGRVAGMSQAQQTFDVKVTKGSHPVVLEPLTNLGDSFDFKVTDSLSGENVLFYTKDLLTAQMSTPGFARYGTRAYPAIQVSKE